MSLVNRRTRIIRTSFRQKRDNTTWHKSNKPRLPSLPSVKNVDHSSVCKGLSVRDVGKVSALLQLRSSTTPARDLPSPTPSLLLSPLPLSSLALEYSPSRQLLPFTIAATASPSNADRFLCLGSSSALSFPLFLALRERRNGRARRTGSPVVDGSVGGTTPTRWTPTRRNPPTRRCAV